MSENIETSIDKDLEPANRRSYVKDEFDHLAENLMDVPMIDNIIRTLLNKTIVKNMEADPGSLGTEDRMRYKAEYAFYKKLHSAIFAMRKRRK